jgi:hypothetical protein
MEHSLQADSALPALPTVCDAIQQLLASSALTAAIF